MFFTTNIRFLGIFYTNVKFSGALGMWLEGLSVYEYVGCLLHEMAEFCLYLTVVRGYYIRP